MRLFASLVVAVALVSLAAVTSAFELPEEVYSHMIGRWSVEVATPCAAAFANGVVQIANATSLVDFHANSTRVQNMALTPSGDEDVLSFAGLEPFLLSEGSSGKPKYGYKACRTQTNYMATGKRPSLNVAMARTQLTEVTGVIVPLGKKSKEDPCALDGASQPLGDVVIRTIGLPMEGIAGEKDRQQREAVQYVEISISTRELPGACAANGVGRHAATEHGEKKKTRKRRGLRNTVGASEASSEDAEAAVAHGHVVIRLSKVSPPTKSFLEKFYPSLMFAGLFLLYRVVYGYFSYKSST